MTARDTVRFVAALAIFFAIDMLFFVAFGWDGDASRNITMAAMVVIVAAIREDRK